MILRLVPVLMLACFLSCDLSGDKKYNVTEFQKSFKRKNDGGQYCDDQAEAINIVGSYINATTVTSRFPSDSSELNQGGHFTPICLQPSDLDSVFSFSGYGGGWLDTPCQIDVNFRNGKTIKFCLGNLIFDTKNSKLGLTNCPEHPNINELIKNCK